MGQARNRKAEIDKLKKNGQKQKVEVNKSIGHSMVQGYNSLEEIYEAIEKNNKQAAKEAVSSGLRLSIDTTHISAKNQNDFMEAKELRNPNPMDVITLHNEIVSSNVSLQHFGSNMLSKIDKLYSTIKSYMDCIAEYDNSTEYALNQELGGAENFYYMTKELSEHFYNDIEKVNKHLPTLTKLSYGNDYYQQRNSLAAMYVALYIEATLYIGDKGYSVED